jgi:hypothetical protein
MAEPERLPTVEFQWNQILLRQGAISTQEQAEQLAEVIQYFAGRLPPGLNKALKRREAPE